MAGVFSEAYGHVSDVRSFVTDAISDSRSWADSARRAAEIALGGLSGFQPDYTSSEMPDAPKFDMAFDGDFSLPEITPTSFGEVGVTIPSGPGLSRVRDIPDLAIDGFTPSIQGLTIPDAPTPTAFSMPDAPTLQDAALPTAPRLEMPLFPVLDEISIPDFDFKTLPTFDEAAPEFEGSMVNAVLQWKEEPYRTEVMDEVVGKLREIWAGGNGIPVAIEQALWERAAEREDIDLRRALSSLDVEYSSRGFTQPPGVLAAQKQALREESMLRKQTASRDIAIRMAEIHIDNVKFACEQGIAAENIYYNIWSNMAQRQFEAARLQLDSELALFNAQVQLFNARQQAYSVKAEVWKAEIDARLTALRAEIDAELARGQLNEQRVKVYSEKISALLSQVEVYKAEMQGAALAEDANRNRIERYKAEVSAMAEKIQADKSRFDAYDSQVRGELGKAQILDAEARAYSAYVSGQASVADVHAKRTDVDLRRNDLELRAYLGKLEAAKAEMQAQSEKIRAAANAYTADTQRYTAQAQAEGSRHQVEITAKEAEIRATIGLYETEIRRYIADVEAMISKANLQLEALKSAGQVSSTLAAGAMAGISIGANLSGGGTVSASGSSTLSKQNSSSASFNFSTEGDSGPTPPSMVWQNYG